MASLRCHTLWGQRRWGSVATLFLQRTRAVMSTTKLCNELGALARLGGRLSDLATARCLADGAENFFNDVILYLECSGGDRDAVNRCVCASPLCDARRAFIGCLS